MSVEALAWALNVPIRAQDKLVLIGLANHADRDGGNAWPSVPTLARYACCSDRTVQRSITRLEECGLIVDTEERRHGVRVWSLPIHTTFLGCQIVTGDTALSPGGDTAVSPEPSLTVHRNPSWASTATQPWGNERNRELSVLDGGVA